MMSEIDTLLSDYDETVQAISRALHEQVVAALPDANEIVTGHKNISYHTDAGVMKGGMVYIAPFKASVNLGFMDGVDLPDPAGLLKGTGKRLRHIKFTTLAQVTEREAAVRALLDAAREHEAQRNTE